MVSCEAVNQPAWRDTYGYQKQEDLTRELYLLAISPFTMMNAAGDPCGLSTEGLAEMLGVSVGHAYKLIRKLNQELEKEGFLVIAGKVPRRYFEKRWYGFSA